ncbi:MAG: VanZ family protein [Bacteroidota bacterium]|nr:VanZ family protein [Bacteroidota bacterium]
MNNFSKNIFFPRLNLILYVFLLVITPFLFLKNYLQEAIGEISRWSVNLGFVQAPVIFSAFLIGLVFAIVFYRKYFSGMNLLIWIIVFLLWALGQQSSDHYLDTRFYDLQNNWHYIAYGIYVFLIQQLLITKKRKTAKNILIVFFLALGISTFDETFQFFISSRVFDISDIAKDLWGTIMGLIVYYLITSSTENKIAIEKIRQEKLKDYLNAPFPTLVLLLIFTYILLFTSSLLSEIKYSGQSVLISISLFLIVLFIIQKTNSKRNRTIALIIGIILMTTQIASYIMNYNNAISYNSSMIVVYKGIPIPYFDFLIRENGTIKLMDKKSNFNQTDIKYLFTKTSNILIIGGCSDDDTGSIGFPESLKSQFIFNPIINKAIQVIILPLDEACATFNRIKKSEKDVALIIHNYN